MLLEKIKNLPNKPGCYIYKNKDDQIIYVGKAKDLKKRVSTYFNRAHNIKTTRLVREINDIEIIVVKNEVESLLLEENLIKEHRPKYNILLNDDKAYPYIIVTNEKDPEYRYVRKFDKKALKSFGPLPIGSNAREILHTLQRLFPLRRCKGNLGKPCLYYHIQQCSGACFKEVDASYYKEQIKNVDKFFKGNITDVKEQLEMRMGQASNNLQFEEAQRIKDKLNSLNFITSKQDVEFDSNKNIDVIDFDINDEKVALSILFYRAGKLLSKDEHIQVYLEEDMTEIVQEFLKQIYQKNMIPNQIIIPTSVEISDLDEEFKKIATHPITKMEIKLSGLALNNAKEALRNSLLAQNVNIGNEEEILKALKDKASLSKTPLHIEMFDISNIANEFITGSCIVYKNGKPVRNEFRRYNIESIYTSDYDRLKNMSYRRMQKALLEKRKLPDLIIADGGIIQVHAIKEQLQLLDLNIEVIGLVKDDYHRTEYMLDINEIKVNIKEDKQLYNWLVNLQTRVDEYAKSGFRKKQTNSLIKNNLLDIPGLGEKRIQELLKIYPTLTSLKQATYDELNNIIKNKEVSESLVQWLIKH